MTRGPRPIGESSRVPHRPLNTTATEASSGPGPQTAPAAPLPKPRTAEGKSKKVEKDAERRAYPVPIGGPGSPRHEFRALRQNPENALLNDIQFEKKYGLPIKTTSQVLGPQSGERNAGTRSVNEVIRNGILANGGPDIGFNPKGDLDYRRKILMLISDPAAAPAPRPAAVKSIQAERNAQVRAYPVPIGGPDSPRHQFRALRQNPENARLNDVQFEAKYDLVRGISGNILGPQSGERNAGIQGVSNETRNRILANGGPDIGINPKGDLDYRRKVLMLIPDPAVAPAPRTVAEEAGKAPGIASRPTYPIGGPGSPRHEFRALRQNPENARLNDTQFEEKYHLSRKTTEKILGPKSGERNAGLHGISKETRNRILANGGPDIGFNPRGSLDRRRKALIAAAAAEVPRAEAAAQDPVLGARASSALPDSPPRGAGEGPAKRPRLDTGLQNEPSMSDPFMAHQYPFAGQYGLDEAGPSSRPLPPFPERPGSGDRPAADPQGGGHRSPSPDPQQDYIDAILQSFKDY